MNFTKIIESKTPEENQKSFEEKINFIKEAKKIIHETREYNRFYPNPNWNDSPGEWLGISAQDLGVPNC